MSFIALDLIPPATRLQCNTYDIRSLVTIFERRPDRHQCKMVTRTHPCIRCEVVWERWSGRKKKRAGREHETMILAPPPAIWIRSPSSLSMTGDLQGNRISFNGIDCGGAAGDNTVFCCGYGKLENWKAHRRTKIAPSTPPRSNTGHREWLSPSPPLSPLSGTRVRENVQS